MTIGADGYAALLEALYSGIESLPTEDYQWSTSDRFEQARYIDADRGSSRHLEVWIDLGAATIGATSIDHNGSLTIVHRYSPDDDSLSQARIHAATRAVIDYLVTFRAPGCDRVRPASYSIEALSAEWVQTTITHQTRIARTA